MMGRAERRRTQKLEQKAKTTTYNLTKEQLNIAVREQVGKELERIKQEATDDAVNTAMVLLLTRAKQHEICNWNYYRNCVSGRSNSIKSN